MKEGKNKKGKGRRRSGGERSTVVRTLDVPVPSAVESLEQVLGSKLGSRAAAERMIVSVAEDFGLPPEAMRSVSAAIALTRLGIDMDRIARSLAWVEFEGYCATAISAAGYTVKRNVRLRKPTRQIDIIAESPSLVLSIDCKHWRRALGETGLKTMVRAQAERTRMYADRLRTAREVPMLPMLLTMVDNPVRVVEGVPIVPLPALREFLTSVSRFDAGLSYVESSQAAL